MTNTKKLGQSSRSRSFIKYVLFTMLVAVLQAGKKGKSEADGTVKWKDQPGMPKLPKGSTIEYTEHHVTGLTRMISVTIRIENIPHKQYYYLGDPHDKDGPAHRLYCPPKEKAKGFYQDLAKFIVKHTRFGLDNSVRWPQTQELPTNNFGVQSNSHLYEDKAAKMQRIMAESQKELDDLKQRVQSRDERTQQVHKLHPETKKVIEKLLQDPEIFEEARKFPEIFEEARKIALQLPNTPAATLEFLTDTNLHPRKGLALLEGFDFDNTLRQAVTQFFNRPISTAAFNLVLEKLTASTVDVALLAG